MASIFSALAAAVTVVTADVLSKYQAPGHQPTIPFAAVGIHGGIAIVTCSFAFPVAKIPLEGEGEIGGGDILTALG